jgi:ethanolamine utilization protein EutJ
MGLEDGLQSIAEIEVSADERIRELERVMHEGPLRAQGELYAGVDLGTANVVLVVVDGAGKPVAASLTPARVVRDGLVVEFMEAISIVRGMVSDLEAGLGRNLKWASTGVPPGTGEADTRGIINVVQAAGLEVLSVVDEPAAAAAVLGVQDGAVVDVGGGTTGISVLEKGRVVYTADEPTGGTHFTLVIAGHFKMEYDQAERLKKDPSRQKNILPVVIPCIEKVASIIERHLKGRQVDRLHLVGGACCLPGFAEVIEKRLGVRTLIPCNPLLVTPLGIAMNCRK